MIDLELDKDSRAAVITFANSPSGLFTGAMAKELEDQVDSLAQNDTVNTLILTGTGSTFIRHFDLDELAASADALAEAPSPPDATWQDSVFHRITRKLESLPQVVIAAINGTCMGVGYELALACDIRIASAGDYDLGLPEMHIGMFPGGGGTVRLARLVNPAKALELIATATTVCPDRAEQLGLVNRVEEDALAAARGLAARLACLSRNALAAAKRITLNARDLDIESALTFEQREVNGHLGSDEVRTRLRTMIENGIDIRTPPPSAIDTRNSKEG
jgi:enoyl-CoA hydratase/carnithine racemase